MVWSLLYMYRVTHAAKGKAAKRRVVLLRLCSDATTHPYDADGDSLTHVAYGKAAERRKLLERLDAQRLGRLQLHYGRVAALYRLRVLLNGLS